MTVEFSAEAERDLKRLGKKIAGRIVSRILWFAENFDAQIPQPLGGKFKGFYKLRIGDWRAIYEVDRDEDVLVVHLVDHRSKIYRRN
ncbi:MAG: type II toxin-antitoxin system RelE/ParE family toxin [Candidatus Uhrbacteria bacterium]